MGLFDNMSNGFGFSTSHMAGHNSFSYDDEDDDDFVYGWKYDAAKRKAKEADITDSAWKYANPRDATDLIIAAQKNVELNKEPEFKEGDFGVFRNGRWERVQTARAKEAPKEEYSYRNTSREPIRLNRRLTKMELYNLNERGFQDQEHRESYLRFLAASPQEQAWVKAQYDKLDYSTYNYYCIHNHKMAEEIDKYTDKYWKISENRRLGMFGD